MTIIEEELKNLILQIREETKFGGNTKERVANTFDRLVQFVEEKFKNNKSESLTFLGTPTLVDNVFYLKYTDENGSEQTVSADLSGLTPEIVLPTKTSEFRNDGEDGLNPFITLYDIPAPIPQVNSNWNATLGPGVILNKPTELSQFNNDTRFITIDDIPDVDISTKAETNASNLSAPNVISWRNALDIYSKSQVDTALALKLDKPQTDGSWVVTRSGATYSYTDASNFGKNIGNSHITSIANSSFTLGTNYTINTSGYYFNITNLPDKSADSTFAKFLVQNTSGQVASTNGKQMMTTLPSMLTEAEKNTWKTEMNGGWSTGTMSVAIISPPVVDRRNQPYWINLKGTNLNLPPTSFKIELCTGESSSAATANVVIEIPASQIQLYSNGLDLTFYYNFKDIPEGTYKLRLWNGVAYYLTSFTLNVVTEINSVDLNNIIWSRKIYNNAISPAITESGSSVSYSSDSSVKPYADDSSFVAARMTNELVGANQDFYMTVEITGMPGTLMSGAGLMTHFIGLVNPNTTVDLLNQTVVNVRLVQNYWYPMVKFYPDNSASFLPAQTGGYGVTAIFVRRGGNWTIIITYNNQTLLYTKTGYTGAIAFGMYNQNTQISTGVNANIVELYKF